MSRTIILALLLILNHSLLFGASQAAYIPDEAHPYGHAYQHDHLHQHVSDHGHGHDHDHDQANRTATDPAADVHDRDASHSHGIHFPLSCDLPFTLSFTLPGQERFHPASHQNEHASLAFAPPVPPPNL